MTPTPPEPSTDGGNEYNIGVDFAKADGSIEVITRYENGKTPEYSIDGGDTFHPSIKEAVRELEKTL